MHFAVSCARLIVCPTYASFCVLALSLKIDELKKSLDWAREQLVKTQGEVEAQRRERDRLNGQLIEINSQIAVHQKEVSGLATQTLIYNVLEGQSLYLHVQSHSKRKFGCVFCRQRKRLQNATRPRAKRQNTASCLSALRLWKLRLVMKSGIRLRYVLCCAAIAYRGVSCRARTPTTLLTNKKKCACS